MIVSDVMSKNPISVNPETSVTEAKALMVKERINKLPVLDRTNRLVGIITKNDLTKATPSAATTLDMYELGYLLSKLKVEKVMTKKIITVEYTEVVEEAARIMADNNIGCLPVMKGDLMVGIVTETDLFHVFIDMFGARHRGIRATFELDEKPGQLAKVTQAIADLGGNIVSTVTYDGKSALKRCITCKALQITMKQMEEILTKVGATVSDIREI
jgi:acetoin utilization protein AcuB